MKLSLLLAASCLVALEPLAETATLRGGEDVDGPQGVSKPALQLASLIRSAGPGDDINLKLAEDLLMKVESDPSGIGAIKTLIEPMLKSLMEQVNTSHRSSQIAINNSAAAIGHCIAANSTTTYVPEAPHAKKQYDALLKQHKTCLDEQSPLAALANGCSTNDGILNKIVADRCNMMTVNPTHPADTCSFKHTIEDPEAFFQRMSRYWNEQLALFEQTKKDCAGGSSALTTDKSKCHAYKKKLAQKQSACDIVKEGLTMSACRFKQKLEQACSTYTACYDNNKHEYSRLKNTTQSQVSVRKLQYRMVKRLDCLVNAFDTATNKLDKAKMDKCAAAGEYPTDHLDITYPSSANANATNCTPVLPQDFNHTLVAGCSVNTTKKTTVVSKDESSDIAVGSLFR